jgi:parvulin-like peptidyl-prolyl isomerase
MTWRCRLSWVGMASTLMVCGCLTKAATLEALPPIPSPPTSAAVGNRDEGAEVARSQKPDTSGASNRTVCLINQPVERPAEALHARPAATIRAVVNGELILDEEVNMVCIQQMPGARTPKERQEVFKQALESLIEREILVQDALGKLEHGGPQGAKFLQKIRELASKDFEERWLQPLMKRQHYSSRAEVAEQMRQSGLSMDVMRRWWERNFMATEYVRSRIEPHISRIGHGEISEYYANHRDEYTQPDSVQWQDIFIAESRHASRAAARQFAEALVQRVRQGEDFVKLSAEFDNGESGRFRKGEGQGRKRGEIFPQEAEAVLFRMQDGDIDILECPRGFHILRLVKRQHSGPIPFDVKVQKEIRDKLRMKVFMSERESIVNDLKSKAVIERCDQ